MKVTLVIYGSLATMSGGYLYDRMLVEHLRSCGDQVDVVSLKPARYLGSLVRAPFLQISTECDVLLQDELCHPSLLWFNRRTHRRPIVSIVHNLRADLGGPGRFLYRFIERRYLGAVDAFVFNSEATRVSVRKLVVSDRPELVAVPGGDRLGDMTEAAVEARAIQAGPLRLVFLANVIPGKGLDVLLAALESLPAEDFRLDVVGSCDVEHRYADHVRRKASRLGSSVQFHGVLDGAALSSILRQGQVLALPSYYEGFGIAYLEGMAHGLVAVGSAVGAVPALVSHGVNGFLIEPGDVQRLRNRLDQLIHDRDLLARMGVSALKKYRLQPAWQTSMERIRHFLVALSGDS